MKSMIQVLRKMKTDQDRTPDLLNFTEIKSRIGFEEYYLKSEKYISSSRK